MDVSIKRSLVDLIKSCEDLQFCTFGLGEYPETRHVTNAMNRAIKEIELYFMTTVGSPKYKQIRANPHVCLYYYNPENRHAIRLFGMIEIISDGITKEKYWRADYKKFGYDGVNDPKFAMLHFIPKMYKFYEGKELKQGDI
ncbi:MAG: pyridoxamine 5'-phosphate oxidase family protein [Rickettsiales bacterium]|jgi:general stress protein 26|nr:pyridoxamine 5'-phosphate oxidase family protein [Rickettsiales bacterium]